MVVGLPVVVAGLDVVVSGKYLIEIINNKARHNLIDTKCRCRSDRLDGPASFREPLGQTKVMHIRQGGGTLNHQGVIIYKVCCFAAQFVHYSEVQPSTATLAL